MDGRQKQYDPDELERLYVVEGLTTFQVGLHFGVVSMTICRWLEKLGLTRRRPGRRTGFVYPQPSEAMIRERERDRKRLKRRQRIFADQRLKREELNRSLRAQIQERRKHLFEEQQREIRRLYETERLSTVEVARKLGLSPYCVRDRLADMGIPRRKRGPVPFASRKESA